MVIIGRTGTVPKELRDYMSSGAADPAPACQCKMAASRVTQYSGQPTRHRGCMGDECELMVIIGRTRNQDGGL